MMNLHSKMRRPSGEMGSELNSSTMLEALDRANTTVDLPESFEKASDEKEANTTVTIICKTRDDEKKDIVTIEETDSRPVLASRVHFMTEISQDNVPDDDGAPALIAEKAPVADEVRPVQPKPARQTRKGKKAEENIIKEDKKPEVNEEIHSKINK